MSAFGFKKPGTKIAVTALGFYLIPLIALGVTMYSLFASAYHAKAHESMAALTESRGRAIDLFLRDQVSPLRAMDRSHPIEDPSSSGRLEAVLSGMWPGESGDAYLVNRAGEMQTRPRSGSKSPDLYASFLGSRFSGARVREVDSGDGKLLVGGVWLERKEWLLVVEADLERELQPLFTLRKAVLGVMGSCAAFVILGTLMIARMVAAQQERACREQAKLNEELIQSSKLAALGKLAAGVAHEVNNPLAVIREKAGWMRDLLEEEDVASSPNFQEFEEAVEKIEQHVQRAGGVVHRMLGFARRSEPVRNEILLNDLLRQTATFLDNEVRFRNIEMVWKLDPELPAVQSDASQIQQVVLNLFNNAVDAIDRNGRITVATGHDAAAGTVSIGIRDDGPGMDRDIRERVFDPFFTTKKVGEGTGLGLSISSSIIEKLGGSLRFESEVGQGSEFTILLPVKHHEGT
jgi:two-component system NtrC family sensor kinase